MVSQCNFSDPGDGYSRTEFYHAETRRARTQHTCCECGHKIKPGERYEHVRAKWDGDLGSMDTCDLCVAVREEFCPDGFLHGGLAEAIDEAGEYMTLARLREVMKLRQTIAGLVELVEELNERLAQ